MKQAFELAYEQTEQALQDIDWNSYGSILFISKSIGTVIASAYASRHNIKGKSILFTQMCIRDRPYALRTLDDHR